MAADPFDITPSDDSGSETFKRYLYQAEVTFRYCLDCALGGDVISVIAEHFEDITLECSTGWRFLQVKTRDPERGLWKLSDLTAQHGGLRSLLRTHTEMRRTTAEYTLELHLEGAIAPHDDIQLLLTEAGRKCAKVIEKVGKALRLEPLPCEEFLYKVRISHSLPSRSTITACNLRLLLRQGHHLLASEIEDLYQRTLQLIESAMAADLLSSDWRTTICQSRSLAAQANELFLKKRITPEHLRLLRVKLTSIAQPLLKVFTEPDARPVSPLEEKLIAGGANSDMVVAAKSLRAQATQLELAGC
jgi:hypothetical protein